jgi:L-aspartate oxidase
VGAVRDARPETDAWEATNLHAVASALTAAATLREETRGSHWREDFSERSDSWRGHLVSTMQSDGALHTTFEPISAGSA